MLQGVIDRADAGTAAVLAARRLRSDSNPPGQNDYHVSTVRNRPRLFEHRLAAATSIRVMFIVLCAGGFERMLSGSARTHTCFTADLTPGIFRGRDQILFPDGAFGLDLRGLGQASTLDNGCFLSFFVFSNKVQENGESRKCPDT